jgi:ectoine hydroxylase-related dioxygenase (phytanoyl-CoA dioxygenase family)
MAVVENESVHATPKVAAGLTAEQLAEYHTNGFVVLRQAIDEPSLRRFAAAALTHPPVDQDVPGQTWPGPGRFTLARNAMADPDLAFLMARPEVVEPMRSVLEDDPKVIMFAYYDRTPGGPGLPPHNDYKRWRPIGSSMRWAFAIVPLTDFDEEAGRLEFAPGSHRVAHSADPWAPVHNADRPVRPADDDFVDPQLRRGDLAIVNMHTWHRAEPNRSDRHRIGMFTKWCAASHPPATGYFPYTDEVRRALGPEGEHILGVSSDRPILTTRAVIERVRDKQSQFLFLEDDGRLSLPGGPAEGERSIPDWDDGNFICSLVNALDARLQCRPPWMSWIGDYDEGEHRCRVYGYRLPTHAWGIHAGGTTWLSAEEAAERAADLVDGYEADAVRAWLAEGLVRGKGVTQALGRADQYAC